jgi:hypothetical protein
MWLELVLKRIGAVLRRKESEGFRVETDVCFVAGFLLCKWKTYFRKQKNYYA